MIEMLLVLLLMGILLVLVMPSFLSSIQHQKILGITQQTAMLMRLARLQAIKTASNSVVQIDTAKGTVTAFTDLNGDKVFDPTTEKLLGQVNLSRGVSFMAVSGFTTPPAVAVISSNGSVATAGDCTNPSLDLSCGSFRFQDVRGDKLEVRLLSKTTGRIVLQKYDGTTSSWQPNGEGANAWKWK